MTNKLYYGDNLPIMREKFGSGSVDLIYLDPPFNSGKNYNMIYREENGKASQAQASAFNDTWKWEHEAKELHKAIRGGTATMEKVPGGIIDFLDGMAVILKDTPMHAYLVNMAPRLVEMRRILKPSGNIYLHCDPTASHYLKILMDAVFGMDCFKNEIVWQYQPSSAPRDGFGRKHDNIMRYSKSDEPYFNADAVREPYSPKTLERLKHAGAREKNVEKVLERGGRIPTDVWYVPSLQGNAKEAMGYPTQKPEALLERIIKASCPPDGIVLDPFCGCGTTVAVAERLGFRWIGIDITHLAIGVIKKRLYDTHKAGLRPYQVIGHPEDLEGARNLAKDDKFEFQYWAVDRVGGVPMGDRNRKGADRGVDGIIPFGDNQRVVIQVKGGTLKADDVRALSSVVDHEKAAMGALVTLHEPSKGMVGYAEDQGQYEWIDPKGFTKPYPKIQIITIEKILGGCPVDYPAYAKRDLLKSAQPKTREPRGRQTALSEETT